MCKELGSNRMDDDDDDNAKNGDDDKNTNYTYKYICLDF